MTKRNTKTSGNDAFSSTTDDKRLIIYQCFPRILTNANDSPKPWGTIEENGCGKLNDINLRVLRSIKELGVNTIWLTGIIEHATKSDFTSFGITKDHPSIVKGEAGSPYAIKDYYDVNPALAEDIPNRLEEFKDLVKRIHNEGMKVIIDFVPNHTARVYHSDKAPEGVEDFGANDDITKFFTRDNNYYYIPNQKFSPSLDLNTSEGPYFEFPAKATGNDCFSAFCSEFDWYETVKLNYGKDYGDFSEHFYPIPDTWMKMLNILRYWASMGVDGFRCDMVFMVPLQFWNWVIPQVKEFFPNIIFIGEIYDINLYRPFLEYGHFDFLYDKVNLYDTLVGIERSGVSAARITDCWKVIDGIGDKMLNFLENHDEVRFASPEFADDPSRIVPYLVLSSMISKGPVMIYYGQELGEKGTDNEGFAGNNNRTTIFDYWSVDTIRRWYNQGKCNDERLTSHERWLRKFYRDVLSLCNASPALREGEFFDLMYANLQQPQFDPHSIYCFLRYNREEALLILVNFGYEEKKLNVNIPSLAFEMAELQEGEVECSDLLWKRPYRFTLSKENPIKISLKASEAVILRLRKETENKH